MYTNEGLNEKVHLLKELERKAEDLNTQIENIKNSLKEHMQQAGVYELVGDDWKITWSLVQSNRFDQSTFKNAHPELFDKFVKLTESRRFTLK